MPDALEELKDKLLASYEGQDSRQGDTDRDPELAKLTAAAKALAPNFVKAAWSFTEPQDTEIPSSIGKYHITGVLGTGGMGVVYRAQQASPLERTVAIKVVRKDIASPESIARFEFECLALARLNHPSIASVVDHGADSNGHPFVAMELVEGQPITVFCEQKKLDIRARLKLFAAVCRGVAHAHACGVIHRDLKPSNILVAEQNGAPAPKIIDFGIAKIVDSQLGNQRLTQTHQVFGTLEYVSPEVIDQGAAIADARSDVYSLGCILYELLTGSPPVDLKDARMEGMLSAIRVLRDAIITNPSTRSKLPSGDLDCITLHALQRDPQDRYQSPTTFADDIERYLQLKPIHASPPGPIRKLLKFGLRNKTAVVAATAVLLALTSGLFVAVTSYLNAEASRKLAVAAQEDSTQALNLLSEAAMLANTYDTYGRTKLAELGNRIELVLNDSSFRSPSPKFKLQIMLAASYKARGDFLAARRVLHNASELAKQDWANQDERFQTTIMLAENAIDLKEMDEAIRYAKLARELIDSATDDPVHKSKLKSRAEFVLANAYTLSGKLDEAAKIYASVLASESVASEVDQELTRARAQVMYASILVQKGQKAEALKYSEAGHSTYQRRYGTSHDQSLMAGHNHAIILTTLNHNEEAMALLESILEGRQRVLGREHPDTLMTQAILAKTLASVDQSMRAIDLLVAVLDSGVAESQEFASVHALASRELLKLYRAKQEFELAENAAKRHVASSQLIHGTSWRTDVAKIRLAMIYIDSQKHGEAATLARSVYASLAESLGPNHQYARISAKTAAQALENLGDHEQAKLWRDRLPPKNER